MPSHYTTDTIGHPVVPAGFEPAIFPMSQGCPARWTTGLLLPFYPMQVSMAVRTKDFALHDLSKDPLFAPAALDTIRDIDTLLTVPVMEIKAWDAVLAAGASKPTL
jgi:hypothetical protein